MYRNPEVERHHTTLLDLHDRGMSTREIRDYLNDNNIKPRRTDKWSTSLVFMNLRKLRDRRDRERTYYWEIVAEEMITP